jgi:hypothetical protein
MPYYILFYETLKSLREVIQDLLKMDEITKIEHKRKVENAKKTCIQ